MAQCEHCGDTINIGDEYLSDGTVMYCSERCAVIYGDATEYTFLNWTEDDARQEAQDAQEDAEVEQRQLG